MTSAADKIAEFLGANIVSLDEHRDRVEQTALDLGDKPAVVPPKHTRRTPAVIPDTSEAFDRAWAAFPDALKRSTKRLSWPQWVVVAAEVGEAALERAVRAYAADPEQKAQRARCGAPGFQVWLRQGRYEPFINAPAEPVLVSRVAGWRVPDSIRAAVVGRWGEAWASSWLQPCSYDERRAQLMATTGLAADRLFRDCRAELMACGLRAIVCVRDGEQIGPARVFPTAQGGPTPSEMLAFPDLTLRDAFHARFADERARDWFDGCGWNEDLRVIRTAPGPRRPWLCGPFDDWCKAQRVRWS